MTGLWFKTETHDRSSVQVSVTHDRSLVQVSESSSSQFRDSCTICHVDTSDVVCEGAVGDETRGGW